MDDPKVKENERKREVSVGLKELKKEARESLEAWFEEEGPAPPDMPNFKDLIPISKTGLEGYDPS